jgi:hypothetical protein
MGKERGKMLPLPMTLKPKKEPFTALATAYLED